MTTEKKDIGTQLEWVVAKYLQPIEPFAIPSKNSERSDITSKLFRVECKRWSKKNVIIDKKIWDKILSQMTIEDTKIPILVQSNTSGDIFVSIRIDDFFRKFVYPAYLKED